MSGADLGTDARISEALAHAQGLLRLNGAELLQVGNRIGVERDGAPPCLGLGVLELQGLGAKRAADGNYALDLVEVRPRHSACLAATQGVKEHQTKRDERGPSSVEPRRRWLLG